MDLFDGAKKRIPTGPCWGCSAPTFKGEAHFCRLGAAARATDPASSHQAALRATASGKADAHCHICLEAVIAVPGRTSAEIAKATGLERHEAARRLSDLKVRGLARQGEQRPCRTNGKLAVTWWPVEGA
jgi:predicted HTH transcriptional regulator